MHTKSERIKDWGSAAWVSLKGGVVVEGAIFDFFLSETDLFTNHPKITIWRSEENDLYLRCNPLTIWATKTLGSDFASLLKILKSRKTVGHGSSQNFEFLLKTETSEKQGQSKVKIIRVLRKSLRMQLPKRKIWIQYNEYDFWIHTDVSVQKSLLQISLKNFMKK